MQETKLVLKLPAAFGGGQEYCKKISSGGAGRKRGVGKMNSRPALVVARKIF